MFSILRNSFASLVVAASLASALAQTPPPAEIPADLDGPWLGEIRYGDKSGSFGLEFARQTDGRVLARLWMPNVNAYGVAVGWLAFADGKFSVPGLGESLALDDDVLFGWAFAPELKFAVHRGGEFTTEPQPPEVPIGPEAAWVYRAGAPLWTSPVVANGIAYLGDSAGRFHAVNAVDGKAAWTFDAGTPLFGDAAVSDGAVYFACDGGHLFKVDRATGAEIWRAEIGGGRLKRSLPSTAAAEWDLTAAAPVISEGVVFIGSADGTLNAVDEESGTLLWQFKTAGKIRAAALVEGERVYTGSMDHFVYALDRRTGKLVWRFDTGSPVTTAPVIADGRVVAGTRDKSLLFALDAADGKKVWSVFYWMSWVESAPVLVDGVLYIGASDSRRVRAIDPANGRVLWESQVWGWTWGTPLVDGDTVYYATAGAPEYFITQRASLGALDRATGGLKWRRPLPLLDTSYVSGIPGSLALADGKVLAASLDGTLTAFPLKSPRQLP